MEFEKFPKIPRYRRNIVITEKLDGTNAQVAIEEVEDRDAAYGSNPTILVIHEVEGVLYAVRAGSRNRWLMVHNDNFGFAGWVLSNSLDLITLGPGRHYGEWWGKGIQRGYGLDHKRFSLFNTGRWLGNPDKPECCHVVPMLYAGPQGDDYIEHWLTALERLGSRAAPGFMNPEGVIVYHSAARNLYKVTLDGDEAKG